MAVVLEDIKAYLGADDDSDALLEGCLTDATALINHYVGSAVVPESITDRCTLIVGADLFERRNAPNGIVNQQFQSYDGIGQAPARIARDPMAGVYPMLRRWVLPF